MDALLQKEIEAVKLKNKLERLMVYLDRYAIELDKKQIENSDLKVVFTKRIYDLLK